MIPKVELVRKIAKLTEKLRRQDDAIGLAMERRAALEEQLTKALEEATREPKPHSNAKLTIEEVLAIKASTEKFTVLARRYGVSSTNIQHIKRGWRWGWVR